MVRASSSMVAWLVSAGVNDREPYCIALLVPICGVWTRMKPMPWRWEEYVRREIGREGLKWWSARSSASLYFSFTKVAWCSGSQTKEMSFLTSARRGCRGRQGMGKNCWIGLSSQGMSTRKSHLMREIANAPMFVRVGEDTVTGYDKAR